MRAGRKFETVELIHRGFMLAMRWPGLYLLRLLRRNSRLAILYPSTVEIAKFCLNLLVRVVVIAVTWAFILGIGVGLNWLIDWTLEILAAPTQVRRYSTSIILAFVLTLAVSAAITGFKDLFSLVLAAFRSSSAGRSPGQSGGPEDHRDAQ